MTPPDVPNDIDTEIDIDRLEIATPCPMQWADLVGNEQKRYCGECRLHVYNFAAMTRPEVEGVMSSAVGRVCARLFRRPDGTILTRDCGPVRERLRKRLRRIRVAAAALIGMVGTFALAACGARAAPGGDTPATTPAASTSETPDVPEGPGELLGEVDVEVHIFEELGDVLVPQERLGKIAPPEMAPPETAPPETLTQD